MPAKDQRAQSQKMQENPDELLEGLTELFAELPGLGPKSASRIVGHLLVERRDLAESLAKTLAGALSHAHQCPRCNTLTTSGGLCPVCSDSSRARDVICVVERPADQAAIEASVAYRGQYFVLMGRINPIQGVSPADLGVKKLLDRIKTEPVSEVVIATSYTAEGETTAHMLTAVLRRHAPHLRVTRLARGLPVGVELEYTDAPTLSAAIADRNPGKS